MSRPDLILLGAEGAMGKTFLRFLAPLRRRFNEVIAVDRNESDAESAALARRFDLTIKRMDIDRAKPRPFQSLLRSRQGILLDLMDIDTSFLSGVAFRHGGLSYLNAGFSGPSSHLYESMLHWIRRLPLRAKRPHILFSGMNPGVVNVWVAHGIRAHGTPQEIVEFEYDSSALREAPSRPMLTWNAAQFLSEVCEDPSESVSVDGRIIHHAPNAIVNRRPMKTYLSPFAREPRVPMGSLTGHEECLTLAGEFGVPMTYLYAVNAPTMRFLFRRAKRGRKIKPEELAIGDNVQHRLIGAEHIGVTLEYRDRRVTYFNRVANRDVHGGSATSFQVITGVYAGISALLAGTLKPRTYFTEQLLDSVYAKVVTDRLVTEELVQLKRGKRWVAVSRARLRIGR